MPRYLHEILDLLGPDRRKLPLLILLFIASSLLDIIGLGLMGPYVSLVSNPGGLDGQLEEFFVTLNLPHDAKSVLVFFGVALLGVFLLKAIAAIMVNRSIISFSLNQQMRLRTLLMTAYQFMPYTEFIRRNSAEYIYTIQTLTVQFSNGIVQPALNAISNGLMAIGIMTLLAWQNWVALVLLAGLIIFIISVYDRVFRRHIRGYGIRANDAATSMVRGINEGIEGLKEIRILGKEEYFNNIVKQGAENYSCYQIRSSVISMMPRYIIEMALVGFLVLFVIVTTLLDQDQAQLLPTLGVFGLASIRLLPATTLLASSLIQLRFNRDATHRLHTDMLLAMQTGKERPQEKINAIIHPFERLELADVWFTYPNSNRAAIQGVSLDVRAGECIGLIGASGSGKTTLVDVILGLLTPQAGIMRFNGMSLEDTLGVWRSQIAYLPQQVFIIDDTLRRNIALGIDDADIDNKRIYEALRQARLSDLVDTLPETVETVLGDRGVRLSGGQRQRVALARAFYHRRNILVMDEATSALDNDTEHEIVEEIQRLRGTITLIVIAHRLTTVQYCDRIYQLENGRVAGVGTLGQLIKQHRA